MDSNIILAQQLNLNAEILVKVEGMRAENLRRESNGDAPAYGECDFLGLMAGLGHNERCLMGRG